MDENSHYFQIQESLCIHTKHVVMLVAMVMVCLLPGWRGGVVDGDYPFTGNHGEPVPTVSRAGRTPSR